MDRRTKFAFLGLILTQTVHSLEEYLFRLYDVFPPAQAVSRLISNDLSTGFLAFNILLILFGFWCYLTRVRIDHKSGRAWIWFWIFIEAGNGIGHPLIALLRGGYFPGVITAPLLLAISIYLGLRISQSNPPSIGTQ